MAGALTPEELVDKIRDVHVLGIRSKMQVGPAADHARANITCCIATSEPKEWNGASQSLGCILQTCS